MLLFPVILLAVQISLLAIFVIFALFNYLYGIASLLKPKITKTKHTNRKIAVVIVSYNEKYVIEDTIRACNDLTYSNKVIVLADDSNDPDVVEKHRNLAMAHDCKRVYEHKILQEIVGDDGTLVKLPIELWESSHFVYFHRPTNSGFKAGCLKMLQEYLINTKIELMYLLDADWHPQHDALERCLEVLESQNNVAFVQTKRVSAPKGMSLFQKYIALTEEGFYYVDQVGRQVLGHPILFSGCCALMRLDAIDQVGGFTPGHLTEDLDLTDRLWLNGWKGVYLETVINYGEVPFTYEHFRRQQERWAVGTARALKDYYWQIITTKHLNWFQKISALRQNAYYSTSLFTTIALLIGSLTSLWLYFGWNTYPVEYYLYLVGRGIAPFIIIIYLCLLSNFFETFIMIVIKKRTYIDMLHVPMSVWYMWGSMPTYVIGDLKGFWGVHLEWFCTPKFLRGNVVALTSTSFPIRIINWLICIALIFFYFFQGYALGWADILAYMWIPAFLLVVTE
jgi:cellulose synthase/poly-beta-1,6-N-acetylglucosamine synthase-like glycosyltransferase